MEIERKYLLDRLPDALPEGERIDQGYLALDGDVEVRLRARGGAHTLTVKGGHGLVRTERELPLDDAAFADLWPLTEGRRVEKVRSLVPLEGGRTAEVDVYAGALDGLLVAEVELPSEAEAAAFVPPAWFGADVTGDPRYANQRLATEGAPERG